MAKAKVDSANALYAFAGEVWSYAQTAWKDFCGGEPILVMDVANQVVSCPYARDGVSARVAMTIPAAADPPQEIPADAPHGLQGVPIGSKLLWSREVLKGGSWVREVEYGVFHTPEVFLEKSLKIARPFDSPVSMDAPNMRAIATILSEGVEGIKAKRKAALDYYRARKLALQKDELALKAKMHPDVRGVMQPKNLLLFKEMLRGCLCGRRKPVPRPDFGFPHHWRVGAIRAVSSQMQGGSLVCG